MVHCLAQTDFPQRFQTTCDTVKLNEGKSSRLVAYLGSMSSIVRAVEGVWACFPRTYLKIRASRFAFLNCI